MPDPDPGRAITPRFPTDSKTANTDLLHAFFQWESGQGANPQEAGLRCSRLAYFSELFLASFLQRLDGPSHTLDRLTAGILDAYLGVWYPAESGLATASDLDLQLDAFRRFIAFLGATGRFRGSATEWAGVEHHLDGGERFHRRLREWEELHRQAADDPDWWIRRERWMTAAW